MNVPARGDAAARERHRTLDFIGLRAHATAVGLIQLCEELLNAGVLSADGLDRIKDAICSELAVGTRGLPIEPICQGSTTPEPARSLRRDTEADQAHRLCELR